MSERADAQFRVRARLADVAAAAGTSKPIASRILNGDPTLSVGEELRRRVVEAARALGYRPHAAARGLRRAQTGALGLLVPSLENPVYTQLMRGAFRRAGERGYTVLLAEDFEEQEAGEIFARLVLEGRIDGLLVASVSPGHPLVGLLAERPLPHVFVNRGLPGSGRSVTMDDARAVELAVGHLAVLGHRRIAMVAGPLAFEPVARRTEAFRDLVRRLALEDGPVVEADFDEAAGARATEELLARDPRPTAIYTGTVRQALGALAAATASGLSVPRELSLVAHADTGLAAFVVPALTAVRMPLAALGVAAVDALVEQIETGLTQDVVIPRAPELVVRASSAAPIESPLRAVLGSASGAG